MSVGRLHFCRSFFICLILETKNWQMFSNTCLIHDCGLHKPQGSNLMPCWTFPYQKYVILHISVFTLSIIIFSDLKNILKDEIKVKHLWNSLVSLESKNLTKHQGGFYYSQTSFLKLFGSKSKCVFAVGKIPIQLSKMRDPKSPQTA